MTCREGFRRWLPSDFGEGAGNLGELGGDNGLVRLSVTDQDLGRTALGQQFRARLMELASKGKSECLRSIAVSVCLR